MASKKVQYVVVPADWPRRIRKQSGSRFNSFNPWNKPSRLPARFAAMSTHAGVLPVKVLDSIGEKKAKLIECSPDDLPALRASHPSVRILPVVYFRARRYEA